MHTAQPGKSRKPPSLPPADAELLEQCALFDVHRLSRALTVLYNHHMRETGLTMAQFTLLRNIAAMAPAAMTQIAEAMLMDRTSVTRLIEPLIERGLLATEPGEDRRVRNVIATKDGLAALRRSERAWREAQREFYDCVGPDQWRATRGALRATLKLVREQEGGLESA